MKKPLLLIPFLLALAGCPGKDGGKMSEWKPIYIEGDRICFSVNKDDLLTRYKIFTNGKAYEDILTNANVNFYYPQTCFNITFKKGVMYGASYTLNFKNYYYTFIIDNENKIIGLGR